MIETKRGGMVYLPVNKLHPHPDNPRKDVGDVSELAESIKVSGGVFGLHCAYCPGSDPDTFADFEAGEQPLEVIGNIHDDPGLLETRRESIEQA